MPEDGGIRVFVSEFTISVIHNKRQNHREASKVEDYFDFEWETEMVFTRDMSNLQDVILKISDLSFGESTTETKKQEYRKIFASYLVT